MGNHAAELAIDVVSNTAAAATDLVDVGDVARKASSGVDELGRSAENSARSIGISADAADELGGKAGKATGALGALSSGFELAGAEKYAVALQSAGMATDFLSGVGDSLNLIMESTIIQNIRARAASVAHTVATGAQAVATATMTAGQWALNAAMSANPIALVVIAIVALVAGIVIAYKRSETFRHIVTGAFNAVLDAASAAFHWVQDNWPLLLAIITGPIGLAVFTVVKKWDDIRDAATTTKKWITDKMSAAADFLIGVGSRIKNALLAPFEAVADAVQHILDLIDKIDLPDIDIPLFRVGVTGSLVTAGGSLVGGGSSAGVIQTGPTYEIKNSYVIQGAVDPVSTATQLQEIQEAQERRLGMRAL